MDCFVIFFPKTFPNSTTEEDGTNVYKYLKKQFYKHNHLVLDLEKEIYLPSFISSSIVALVKDVGYSTFNSKVTLVNVDSSIRSFIRQMIVKN